MYKITSEKLENNASKLLNRFSFQENRTSIGEALLLCHGTSSKNLNLILKSDRISSYKSLQENWSEVILDNNLVNTDLLDKKLWLDDYVFLSMWRWSISELNSHYLLFGNQILESEWALSSLLEIAELWSVVSEEARKFYWFSKKKVAKLNSIAKKRFDAWLIKWSDFKNVFDAFYYAHYSDPLEYAMSLEYPLKSPLHKEPFNREIVPRQWPQLMVPYFVEIKRNLYAILDLYWDQQYSYNEKYKVVNLYEVVKEIFGSKTAIELLQYKGLPTDKNMMLINLLIHNLWEMKSLWNHSQDLQSCLITYMKEWWFAKKL